MYTMNHRILVGIIVAAATLFMQVACGNYLAEKPNFIKTCSIADPNLSRCYANNFQSFVREWKDGVPGLKSLGPLDPYYVKRISIVQDKSNPLLQVNVNLLNLKLYGVSTSIMTDSSFDWNKLFVTFKVLVPKVHIDSDYTANGKIVNLPLDSNGHVKMTIENTELLIGMRLKLRDEYGITFADVNKFRLEITNVGGCQVHFENLFNGQKELEDSTNKLINQSWREFMDILISPISEALQTILSNWVTKTFAYVPASYLIADIPSAAEYSG